MLTAGHGVWIGNWIYQTLVTAGNYNSVTDLHTLQITVLQHTWALLGDSSASVFMSSVDGSWLLTNFSWHRTPLGPMAIYLFNVKTFFSPFFVVPPLIKREGSDFPSLTTPYSTRGHIKVGDIYILYIIQKTQTDTKFYYIQGHLSMQDSAAAYASNYLNLRNGS
jgi:hypothetical protein